MKTTKFNGIVHVARNTWRETVTRMMRAEQTLEKKMKLFAAYAAVTKQLLDSSKDLAFEDGRQHGQEQVLRLIARWGKARPLEGMGGADMAEALRKVLTPTTAPERCTSTEIEHLPHGQHVVTHKSEPEPAGNAAWEIEDYDWRPAGNGLEERKVTRTTMEFRCLPTGCDPK